MSDTFILEGLKDLETSMMEFSRAVNIGIAKRALKSAAEPLVEMAMDLAPVLSGHLEMNIAASDQLSRRQKALNVKKSEVEVYVGPDNAPQGVQQEFGNSDQHPQPFLRPAWDATKMDVMFNIQTDLAAEIKKVADRAARRQARLIAQARAGS